jgi:16S rRNA (guanine527-N7)-methyltransferase
VYQTQKLMLKDRTDDISTVLTAVAADVTRVDLDKLTIFLEELFRWNPQLGLVSKQNTPDVIVRLIQRSMQMWQFVADHTGLTPSGVAKGAHAQPIRVADVGSGGGFPGLLWKLLDPGLGVTLIERKDRKVTFLERAIMRMGIEGTEAVSADVVDFARKESSQGAFDVVVLMAVSDPGTLAGPIEKILKASGYLCAVRGRDQAPQAPRLGGALVERVSDERPDGRYLLYQKE